MKEFQVPTRAVCVEMFLADGEQVRGRVFVPHDPRHPAHTDQLIGALNDEREFLPFEVGDDRSARNLVLNKKHIVRVRTLQPDVADEEGDGPGWERESDTGHETILHLSDGTQVSGRVLVDTPEASSRLVDKINCGTRFIPIIRDDGIEIVQRTHVLTLD